MNVSNGFKFIYLTRHFNNSLLNLKFNKVSSSLLKCTKICANNRFIFDDRKVYVDSTNMAIKRYENNDKMKKIFNMLSAYDYTEKQINAIFESIGQYIVDEPKLNDKAIRDCIDCWANNMHPPKLKPNQLDKFNLEDIDYHMAIDLNTVLSEIEPKLLLMTPESIETRTGKIMDLGIILSSKDLWRIFVYAPRGYYLQNWNDLLKKYYYLNFIVLEWLFDKKQKENLYLHPLVRNSKILELDFGHIKGRYLFARRTGFKTVSIVNTLKSVSNEKKVDLSDLMLTSVDEYLQLIAPKCTDEEYRVFEQIVNEKEDDDEEKTIDELIEVDQLQHTKSKDTIKPYKLKEQLKQLAQVEYQVIEPVREPM